MRRLALSALVLALALVPGPALGDELAATLSQPLAEVSHSVDLRIEDGTAIYVVRRTFANTGPGADEAQLDIDLPMGAAVTGLRIRARDRWYAAELMERDAAAAKYQELTSRGAWAPKDPALLQWVWADQMHLQVFPVLPGSTSTVEYTLTAPLHYRNGHYVLSYPRASTDPEHGLPLATPVLRVDPGHGDATTFVRVDNQPVAPNMPVVLGAPLAAPWVGEGGPSSGVGYGFSSLDVVEPGLVKTAAVTIDIDHTYRGDLQVALVTPAGVHVPVGDFSGADNDVHDRFEVSLPPKTEAEGSWHLVVSDHMGLDVGTLDAWSLKLAEGDDPDAPGFRELPSSNVPVFIPDAPADDGDEGLVLIEVDAAPIEELASRYGTVTVDDHTNFLRLELEAAEELRPAPTRASIVFVIDASHSADAVESQLGILRGYMAHVPDARAEVVLFRRFAERLTDDFLEADELWPALAKAEADGRLELGNGSAMEEGIALAGRALRGRAGPRRVVVLTDARLRSRFTTDHGLDAIAAAPPRTIAHIVVPSGDGHELRFVRDDTHTLSSIAATTGGVLFGLEGGGWDASDKELEHAAEGLVRPTSIDFFEIRGVDLTLAPEVPEVFLEGASYGFMMESATAPRRVTMVGKIWNREFRRVVRPSRSFSDATAAFVFSEDEHHDLSSEQMMTVAMQGKAVSPVTSYLATEPGVRPSTIGIEMTGRGGGGSGSGALGLGNVGLIGRGGGGATAKRWTLEELIAEGADACVATHKPAAGVRVQLEVETTSQEIVDVQAKAGPPAFAACLVEAAWAVELTWNFRDERKTIALSLPER